MGGQSIESAKHKKRRPKSYRWKKAESRLSTKTDVEADLLQKGGSAYRAGRLEESQRFFQWALQLKPTSIEAKKGLEKIAAEMK